MGGVRQLVKIGQTAGGLLCRRKSRHGGLFAVGLSERPARVCADGVQDGGEICFAEGAVPAAHDTLIARELKVTVGGARHEMHQRVEPVDGDAQQQKKLGPQIAAPAMDGFVREDHVQILL